MALINTGPNYTRTGQTDAPGFANTLQRWANKISIIPGMGWLTWPMGMLGSTIESLGHLVRGRIGSAATTLAAGAVSNSINAAASTAGFGSLLYWGNLGSGLASGSTLGTHGRALTEGAIGAVTGALGMRPAVLRSYTAGVGSIGGQGQSGPGYYATRYANERGQDPNAMYANYRSGAGAEHVAALEASRANGPAYRG